MIAALAGAAFADCHPTGHDFRTRVHAASGSGNKARLARSTGSADALATWKMLPRLGGPDRHRSSPVRMAVMGLPLAVWLRIHPAE